MTLVCMLKLFLLSLSKQKQMKLDSLTPVQLLLENCLYPHITNRSADLLDILKQDYCLDKYFAAVKVSSVYGDWLLNLLVQSLFIESLISYGIPTWWLVLVGVEEKNNV